MHSLTFLRPVVQQQFHWAKIKVEAGLSYSVALRESLFFQLPVAAGLPLVVGASPNFRLCLTLRSALSVCRSRASLFIMTLWH